MHGNDLEKQKGHTASHKVEVALHWESLAGLYVHSAFWYAMRYSVQ